MRKKSSTDSSPFTFRLEKADREWLETTAQKHGLEVSQLVRWSIEALKQYVERHQGNIHLPIDIRTMWQLVQETKPQPILRVADEPSDSQESQTTRKEVNYRQVKKADG